MREYTERLDKVRLESFAVTAAEFDAAGRTLTLEQLEALHRAIGTVTRFHATQSLAAVRLETSPGVVCERVMVPLAAVGLYVPGGRAVYPSSVVMNVIPAQLAGVGSIAIAST